MISTFTTPSFVNRVKESWQAGYGVTQSNPVSGGPFTQAGFTLDMNFAAVPQQNSIWVANQGLTTKTFSDIITFTRASAGSYVNSAGDVAYENYDDVPRFSYNPVTLAPLGFLIEEQRTNVIGDPFTSGEWNLTTCTLDSYAGVTSPAADSFSYGMASTGGAGTTPVIFNDFVKAASAITYTASMWVKGNTSSFSFTLDDGTATNRGRSIFNLVAGTLTSAVNDGTFTNTSATISAYKNSWYRITITTTTNTTTTVRLRFFFTADGAATPIVYLYAPQLETGAFATSYINTAPTNAPTTRAADVGRINTLSPWFNNAAGTLYAEYNIPYTPGATQNVEIASLVGATGVTSNGIAFYVNGPSGKKGSTNAWVSGVSAGRIDTTATFVAGANVKYAAAYATSDRAVTASGVAPTTSATVYTPPTISYVSLGSTQLGYLSGYLQRITYYPRRVTNTELQTLTA